MAETPEKKEDPRVMHMKKLVDREQMDLSPKIREACFKAGLLVIDSTVKNPIQANGADRAETVPIQLFKPDEIEVAQSFVDRLVLSLQKHHHDKLSVTVDPKAGLVHRSMDWQNIPLRSPLGKICMDKGMEALSIFTRVLRTGDTSHIADGLPLQANQEVIANAQKFMDGLLEDLQGAFASRHKTRHNIAIEVVSQQEFLERYLGE